MKTYDSKEKIQFLRVLCMGLFAGLIYGVIALIANGSHSFLIQVKTFFTNFVFCLIMTIFSASMMEFYFLQFKSLPKKYLFTVILSGVTSFSLMLIIHLISGTPELFKTMFYSSLTAIPYYILYPLKLAIDYSEKNYDIQYRFDSNWDREWKVVWLSCPYKLKDFFGVLLRNITHVSVKNHEDISPLDKEFSINKQGAGNLKIAFLGDLMPMYKYGWSLSDDLKKSLDEIDYLVCNFEGLLDGLKDSNPVFLSQNHNMNLLNSLKDIIPAHKIILSVANNHSADYGHEYFKLNIQALKEEGFIVIGDRLNPGVKLKEKIYIHAATQWTNQPHGYLSFIENAVPIETQDHFNLLYPHWGIELDYFPRKDQRNMAKSLLNTWDSIVGHHTHIPGPLEILEINGIRKLVAYSLGDSATALPRRRYKFGKVLLLNFQTKLDEKPILVGGHWMFTQLKKINKSNFELQTIDLYPPLTRSLS